MYVYTIQSTIFQNNIVKFFSSRKADEQFLLLENGWGLEDEGLILRGDIRFLILREISVVQKKKMNPMHYPIVSMGLVYLLTFACFSMGKCR